MQDVIVAVRDAVTSVTAGVAFRMELEGHMRPDAIMSSVSQAHPALYYQLRNVLDPSTVPADHRAIAGNAPVAHKVIGRICPSAAPAIIYSSK